MESPVSSAPDPSPAANRERALGIIATVLVLALLYLARGVLVPITLAVILSLLIAPLVRILRRLGLGQTLSVLAAVLVLALSFAAVAGVIGSQLIRMTESLPRYERTIERKLRTLNEVTVGRFNTLTGQAGRWMYRRAMAEPSEATEKPRTRQRQSTRQHTGTAERRAAGELTDVSPSPETTEPSSAAREPDSSGQADTEQPQLTAQPQSTEPDASQPSHAPQPTEAAEQPSEAAESSGAAQRSQALEQPPAVDQGRLLQRSQTAASNGPIAVEVHEPPLNPLQIIERVLGSIWVPIETAGIVLVVMVFVLLEHEALRDRFIRIAGGTDIRLTTLAINDAGERLSRFFVSQFAVNFGLGLTVWVGLTIIGLPHPLLWSALAGVLRFVPYVGVWIAALCAVLLAAAVEPHWTLALTTLGLFVVVELIAGQLVEPRLYGHTTGLSPLSVVIAAIFWSWLWGPIGLIVSTPLTLCLLVAGRHIKALSLLDVLLGDTQALTMPERFYQRALSADSAEIIVGARAFLKRNSFANYCDLVLMPALHLARIDLIAGTISVDQQAKVRTTMVEVIAAIGGDSRRLSRRHRRASVLDDANAGRQLRRQREQVSGQWQGPLVVPPGSVAVCVGLGSIADDLATELLVRILRDQKIDARHMSIEDLNVVPPPGAADAVSIVYVVSAFPSEERGRGDSTAEEMRRRFPHACLVGVLLPGMLLQPETAAASIRGADKAASSLGHAVQICLDLHRADVI